MIAFKIDKFVFNYIPDVASCPGPPGPPLDCEAFPLPFLLPTAAFFKSLM